MYIIKVQASLFHSKKIKAEKHWVEFSVNGVPIIPRLVILTCSHDIVIISGILSRDWGIYGIQNANSSGTRPLSDEDTATNAAREPTKLLAKDDRNGQSESAAAESNESGARAV